MTLRQIAEDGIGAVSNRRVAAEAGVSLGSLTYHFPSQTQLLRESLLLHVSEEGAELGAVADRLRTLPTVAEVAVEVEQAFRKSVQGYGPRAAVELYLHATRDSDLQDVAQQSFAAYENFVTAALDGLGVPEADRHAPMVVAMLSGFALRGRASGDDVPGLADVLITIVRGAAARTPLAERTV